MKIVLLALSAYATLFVSWVLYLAVMNLKEHRHELGPVAKVHAYVLLAVGLVVDLFLTAVIGTVIFADPPKEWTFTGRLKRYHQPPYNPGTWRYKVARWICEHLLDQFDPKGKHC